eukprot:CAMPEP_0178500354 /NCGR_PEP_ID=MMETSP0696-20121128/16338_1 /TAXON_ID=265572 /ORGANISM="Extubocellulus spinifer, Strain CCMP396" /LENGTH=104 /DNA_ID=CAMNT_0020129163 /DNA_START=36 /DNA_END=351 /DNA_ORIENTATION=-
MMRGCCCPTSPTSASSSTSTRSTCTANNTSTIATCSSTARTNDGNTERPPQGNSLLQRRHGEGIGTAVIGQVNRRNDRSVPVTVGLDNNNDAASLRDAASSTMA